MLLFKHSLTIPSIWLLIEMTLSTSQIFVGNSDRYQVVSHLLDKPIIARSIRIQPMTWYGHISMRAEFYGCAIGKNLTNYVTAKREALMSRSDSKLKSILRILYVRGPKFSIWLSPKLLWNSFGVEMRCLPVSVRSVCMDIVPRKILKWQRFMGATWEDRGGRISPFKSAI